MATAPSQGGEGEGAQAGGLPRRTVALLALAIDADQQPDARAPPGSRGPGDARGNIDGHYPHVPASPSHNRSHSVTSTLFRATYAAPEVSMSLAGTTGIYDSVQRSSARRSARRRRLRLLPYALLAPSLLFLVLFTYLPVARVAGGIALRQAAWHGRRHSFVGPRQLRPGAGRSRLPPGRAQQPGLCRGRAGADPGAGAGLRARRAALDALLGRAAHGVLLSVAGAAGRRGLAVLLHLPAAASACSTTTSRRSACTARTGWAIPTWRCGR